MRRAARNYATSSNRLFCETKKKDNREAKVSMSRSLDSAARMYSMALENVKANSWTAVAPASRMWYPLMLIVFHRGALRLQYWKMSVIKRIDGFGG